MKTKKLLSITAAVAAAAALMAGVQSVPAQSVGVHFVSAGGPSVQNGSPDSLASTDVAGAPSYAQANWNNLGRNGDSYGNWEWATWINSPAGPGAPVVLTNSVGDPTSLKITWAAAGSGSTGTAAGLGTADGKLMDGFIDSYDGSTPNLLSNNGPVYFGTSANQLPAISINGLSSWLANFPGAVGYNVVLYFSPAAYGPVIKGYVNAATGDPASGTLTEVGAAAPPKYGHSGTFAGTYVEATSTDSGSATAANYMVFAGLTNDVIVIHEDMQGWQGALNGFQIVPTFVSSASTLPLASTNALLASLSLTPAGTLVPTFASGTTGYNATNAYANNPVTVAAVSAEAHATLALNLNGGGYGAAVTNNLSVGGNTLVLPTNTVLVRVVSQDLSQTNLYKVNVLLQPSLTVPNLTNSVSGNNLMLAWPSDHLGYRLLVQTNNLQNGVSANTNDWGTLAGSQTITTTNITVQTTNLNEFYRLVYP